MIITITNKVLNRSIDIVDTDPLYPMLQELTEAIDEAKEARSISNRNWDRNYTDPEGLREQACRLEELAHRKDREIGQWLAKQNKAHYNKVMGLMFCWYSISEAHEEEEDDSYF
jgi:hypothetical protein